MSVLLLALLCAPSQIGLRDGDVKLQPGTPYAARYPKAMLPYENSVCQIRVTERRSGNATYRAMGSGILMDVSKWRPTGTYVLTAFHVVNDRKRDEPVLVTWDGVTEYKFYVSAARPGCDSALLKLHEGQAIPGTIPRVPVAEQEITMGEYAFAFGFGPNHTLRCSGGKVVGFGETSQFDKVFFEFYGQYREGDSGGPVLVFRNGEPRLVGAAWGTSYDQKYRGWTIAGCKLRVLHRLFGLEKAPVRPYPGGRNRRVYTSGSS